MRFSVLLLAAIVVAVPAHADIVVDGKKVVKPKPACGGNRWTNCRMMAPESIEAQAETVAYGVNTARPIYTVAHRAPPVINWGDRAAILNEAAILNAIERH